MRNRGFTLVEILVAFFLFILVLGGVLGLVQTAVQVQRDVLERQAAAEETFFAIDHMVRAMRGAQKDLGPTCLVPPPSSLGYGYTADFSGARIIFIDRNDKCHQFFQDGGTDLNETISPDNTAAGLFTVFTNQVIASDDFEMRNKWQRDHGTFQGDAISPDYIQPHVTFTLVVHSARSGKPLVSMQTTVTTRTLDVEE